jgi:hypothetical protein
MCGSCGKKEGTAQKPLTPISVCAVSGTNRQVSGPAPAVVGAVLVQATETGQALLHGATSVMPAADGTGSSQMSGRLTAKFSFIKGLWLYIRRGRDWSSASFPPLAMFTSSSTSW